MNKKRKIIITLVALLSVGNVMAQTAEDIYRISFKNRATGTARSAAMGGAFTSLGADGASITLNPAGLGMYRSSEVSFTPSLFISTVNSFSQLDNSSLGSLLTKEKTTNFTMNNFSSIFNIYNSREHKAVKSLTIGVSYSKDNYTNYKSESVSDYTGGSMGDFFAAQLYGVKKKDISDSNYFGELGEYHANSPSLWGGIMAYNTFLIDAKNTPKPGESQSYWINPSVLSTGDQVAPSQRITKKSTIDNFNVSFGINIEDILYLGATMGSRFYEYHNTNEYQEDDNLDNTGTFRQLNYIQYNNVTGSAFDFKLGATLEPISGLKIGAAFHFPTITYIEDEYYADMTTLLYKDETNQIEYLDALTPYNPITYNVKSAPSLLTGISYRLPFGILSFDYERTWYNKMKVTELGGAEDLNAEIRDTYKATNNYMVGLEVQPLSGIFLRGGYAYYGSASKDDYADYGSTKNLSAGIGYKRNSYYIDFTYTNSKYKTAPYKYYEGVFVNPDIPTEDITVASENTISQEFKNTVLSLTVGFRF